MAKVKIQGHASGTGVLTVTAPNTSTDRTITLPDSTGTLATTADTTDLDGAITINESGADVDFRVESDTNTHAFFIQGSDGKIGIGESTPTTHQLCFGEDSGSGDSGASSGISFRASATENYISMSTVGGANNGARGLVINREGSNELIKFCGDGRGVSPFTARAWGRIDQTGTQAINMSHNCSSIADNGTGDSTVSFTNAIGSTLYCVLTGNAAENEWSERPNPNVTATGSVKLQNVNHSSTFRDSSRVHFAVYMS